MNEIKEIKGVYDDDLPKLLKDLGLEEDFNSGKLHCVFSGDVVTMDNFLGIFSDGQEIKLVCNNEACKTKFAGLSQKENG